MANTPRSVGLSERLPQENTLPALCDSHIQRIMSYELHKKPHKRFRHQRIECHICLKRKEIKRSLFCELTVVMEAMPKEPWTLRINIGVCISNLLHSKWLLS